MKNYTALALLSLTLAACSQGTGTPSGTPATAAGHSIIVNDPSHVIYADTQAAYDALVNADLQRLSPQVFTSQGKVYLNVLPVASRPGTVRAYVKSTFASPAVCDLIWGDGTTSPLTSPTTARIETSDHAFSTFGTYTVSARCRNGAAIVGTSSVTLQAGVQTSGTVITFDSPAAPSGYYSVYTSYQENGFNFAGQGRLYTFATDFGGNAYNFGSSQGLYMEFSGGRVLTMAPISGLPFSLQSIDARSAAGNDVSNVSVTGHRGDGSTVTAVTNEIANAGSTLTFDSSWQNLTSVEFTSTGGSAQFILDNVRFVQLRPIPN